MVLTFWAFGHIEDIVDDILCLQRIALAFWLVDLFSCFMFFDWNITYVT